MSILAASVHRFIGMVAELDTTEVSDSGNTATVLVITLLLVVAALVLAGITIWYWRNTVPDPEALASLADLTESRQQPRWSRGRRAGGE